MRNQNQNQRACSSRDASRRCRRRGFTLVEMMVAGVLLMTVSMIVVPAIYWVHRERRQTERRQIAIVEVENLMERVVALPFDQVQQSIVDKFALSESAVRQLPDARLQIKISEATDVKQMKKIQIQLGWKNQQGIRAMPVRLTSWVCLKEQQ
ncbi:prepilin-type N-terminal cleavage/methylation domain-containing protein [Gimesia maris]|uniref:prepilin-type N-terminal cleavage/methylation domain-containing protein n=1 Tax=Gimesia maris TaxID=122 RepID=UPI00241D3CB7|nr:prepilin-type N-terminal cleavage/methylation domain-containing protein [Gimesia maris]